MIIANEPVAIVRASGPAADKPVTTPRMTSPRTMIVNRPNRSTSESVGRMPSAWRPRLREPSCMKTSQAPAKMAQVSTRQDASGNAAVAPTTVVEMIIPPT